MWLRRAVVALAIAYPLVLLAVAMLFRFVGERWWVTAVALYLPRIAWLAPVVPVSLLLVAAGLGRLLWTSLVALLIGLFPLMGLVLPWPARAPEGPHLRLMSFNVNSVHAGPDTVLRAILAQAPDLVVLQEAAYGSGEELAEKLQDHFAEVQSSTQFVIASRLPIVATREPAAVRYGGKGRSARFLEHTVKTPLGIVALFNVHPISAREGLEAVRGEGLQSEFLSGRLLAGSSSDAVRENTGLRALQVETFTRLAAQARGPVILAGDTNLPGLSELAARRLHGYGDGFVEAGAGFGYTFPSNRPFLRLDRVLVSSQLRVVRFTVGCAAASDHLCVVADIAMRR